MVVIDMRQGKVGGVGTGGGSPRGPAHGEVEEGDSGIDANSQGSCSSTEQVKPLDPNSKKKDRKKKKNNSGSQGPNSSGASSNTSTTSTLPISSIIHTSCKQLNSNVRTLIYYSYIPYQSCFSFFKFKFTCR